MRVLKTFMGWVLCGVIGTSAAWAHKGSDAYLEVAASGVVSNLICELNSASFGLLEMS